MTSLSYYLTLHNNWLLVRNAMMPSMTTSCLLLKFQLTNPYNSYKRCHMIIVVISYDIYETRKRLVSYTSYEITNFVYGKIRNINSELYSNTTNPSRKFSCYLQSSEVIEMELFSVFSRMCRRTHTICYCLRIVRCNS